jgi:hypothetical protein
LSPKKSLTSRTLRCTPASTNSMLRSYSLVKRMLNEMPNIIKHKVMAQCWAGITP